MPSFFVMTYHHIKMPEGTTLPAKSNQVNSVDGFLDVAKVMIILNLSNFSEPF